MFFFLLALGKPFRTRKLSFLNIRFCSSLFVCVYVCWCHWKLVRFIQLIVRCLVILVWIQLPMSFARLSLISIRMRSFVAQMHQLQKNWLKNYIETSPNNLTLKTTTSFNIVEIIRNGFLSIVHHTCIHTLTLPPPMTIAIYLLILRRILMEKM